MFALESFVAKDHIVHVIELFINALALRQLGFIIKGEKDNGRPAYPVEVLLKLLYYGYLHKVRSSRPLVREARTNLEAMWLFAQTPVSCN